jgi:hypothetical protein
MPFDNMPAARPYMREMTDSLAALVATNPAEDVIRAVAAELEHRTRPGARKLLAEIQARITGRAVAVVVHEPEPMVAPMPEPVAPVAEPVEAPRQAPKPRKGAMAPKPAEHWQLQRANARARKAAEKLPPMYAFGIEWGAVSLQAVGACRIMGILASGYRYLGGRDGFLAFANNNETLLATWAGAVYLGSYEAENLIDLAVRDDWMAKGRDILGPVAVRAFKGRQAPTYRCDGSGKNIPRLNGRTMTVEKFLHRAMARAS